MRVRVTGTREHRKVSPPVHGEDSHEGALEHQYPLTSAERAGLANNDEVKGDIDGRHYLRHADEQSEAADLAWQKLVEGLSEEDRLKYEELGLIEKRTIAKKKPARKQWVRLEPSEESSFLREQRSEEPNPHEQVCANEEARAASQAQLEATRFILAGIIDSDRPRLEASIIAIALGIGAEQRINASRIVEHFGVPVRAVRAQVKQWNAKIGTERIDLTLPRYVVGQVLDDPRPRLQADTFALAFGFPLRQGMSERKLAIRYGLTVATLSARVRWWIDQMAARLPGVCKRNTSNYQKFNVRRQPADPFRQRQ